VPMLANRRFVLKGAVGTTAILATAPWAGRASAQAARLVIGMSAPNTTLDPHLQSNAPNNAVASHIFDALITNDPTSQSRPGLASSWRLIDDLNWEFTLNPNAVFSDGTPFRAEDAIASVERANTIPSTAPSRPTPAPSPR
jgi:peptide/nickel transport system substrate-binding protein